MRSFDALDEARSLVVNAERRLRYAKSRGRQLTAAQLERMDADTKRVRALFAEVEAAVEAEGDGG